MTITRATKHEKKMLWLGKYRPKLEAQYPGMWVAISDDGLAGIGESLDEAISQAESKGIADVLVAGLKDREYQGVYLIR
jgi:hypothetical protein